ncbi:hypothetical protein [Burkholderia cepacia]|uniref:hypothetical protein n=1 Tax=Burkholderia cepacia TaxID=292 RepID=UPI0012D85C91|nr:hypothetical protein [Burkholderia cepacia]
MESLEQHVAAHAPGTPSEYSDIASRVLASTGTACVAVVTIDPHGNGGYGVAGPFETQVLRTGRAGVALAAVGIGSVIARPRRCAPRPVDRRLAAIDVTTPNARPHRR